MLQILLMHTKIGQALILSPLHIILCLPHTSLKEEGLVLFHSTAEEIEFQKTTMACQVAEGYFTRASDNGYQPVSLLCHGP